MNRYEYDLALKYLRHAAWLLSKKSVASDGVQGNVIDALGDIQRAVNSVELQRDSEDGNHQYVHQPLADIINNWIKV